MQRYKLTIAYDGTNYAGWQVQPNAPTIQACLEEALRRITGRDVKVHGSGRTDRGVHARRQVAHLDLPEPRPARSLRRSLNALIPPDIRVLSARAVEASFHARKSVVEKEYRYFIWNAEVLPPFLRRYRTHVVRPLDTEAMRDAAGRLAGRRDFAAFTANPNRVVESTVRRLDVLEVRRRGAEICIVARGEGFLYKMVRSLAGFLIRVGQGDLAPGEAETILHSGIRTARVETARPEGLFLWNVKY